MSDRPVPGPALSPEVAEFLLRLVNSLSLSTGAADFRDTVPLVLAAQDELGEILAG